jgi:hypothetical protein
MTDDQQATRRSRWRLWLVVGLLVILALSVGGQWWVGRPKRAAEHFIALLSKGQSADTRAVLVEPASLTTEQGRVHIKAADGTTATLTEGELPLVAVVSPDLRARDGVGDYFTGRYRFQVGTSGPAVRNGQKKAIELDCTAEGDKIVITSIKQSAD